MIGKPYPGMPPEIPALAQAHPEGLPDPVIVDTLNAAGFSLSGYYERNNFGRWLDKNPTGKIRKGFMDNLVRDDRYRGEYGIYLRDPMQVGHPDFREMDKESKKKIVLQLPPILAKEVWAELRRKRLSRQVKSKRNVRHEYLAKDFLVCDECGVTMSARPKWSKRADGSYREKPTLYYCCWRKERSNGFKCQAKRCHSAPGVDDLVFERVRGVLLTENTLEALPASEQKLIAPPSLSEFEWSLSEQEKRLRGLSDERETAETKLVQGRLSDPAFDKQVARIDKEKLACEKLIRELKRKIESIQEAQRENPPVDLEPIRKRVLDRLDHLSFDEKRQLVATLVYQVRISPSGEMKILLRPIHSIK